MVTGLNRNPLESLPVWEIPVSRTPKSDILSGLKCHNLTQPWCCTGISIEDVTRTYLYKMFRLYVHSHIRFQEVQCRKLRKFKAAQIFQKYEWV